MRHYAESIPRYKFECRGGGCVTDHRIDVCPPVAAVFGAVGGVEPLVDTAFGFFEPDVALDSRCANGAFTAAGGASEPSGVTSVRRSDVEVVVVSDDPDGDVSPQAAVAALGGDLQFVGVADLFQFVSRPRYTVSLLVMMGFSDRVKVESGLQEHFGDFSDGWKPPASFHAAWA